MAPGSVEYLLHGCDSQPDIEPAQDLDGAQSGVAPEHLVGAQPSRGPASSAGAAGYLQAGVHAGEPAGVWHGHGMQGMGLSMREGDVAEASDVRAIFGQLRYPTEEMPESTDRNPVYLGSKPRRFRTAAQLVEDALKKETGPVTAERRQQIEQTAKKDTRRPTAYYDVTFSPVKSVSLMYAALLAAGDIDDANAIRDAHNEAIRIAIASVENDLAYVRTGRHEGRGPSGRTVGRWERATGLMVAVYAHHTNRDGEPQLHAHAAVSARAATPDGRIYAIDGYGFHSIKDALATAYTRAYQQLTTERLGFVYEQRADGTAREIAGVSEDLLAEGSSRTVDKVRPLVADLVEAYTERHGYEPGPRARRALVEQAVKDTRRPKTGVAGPEAVVAWTDREAGRRERLSAMLDAADRAAVAAVVEGSASRPGRQDEPTVGGRDMALTLLARIDAVRDGTVVDRQTAPRSDADVALAELVMVAVARGVVDVQAKYATWNVGNLARAIDGHLGDRAGALGLQATERPVFLSTITGHVLAEPERFGIVQVSAGDPVPVPDVLRRIGPGEDGRPRFRAHIDERYATAAHLSAERRLLAGIHTTGAVRVGDEQMVAVDEQLERLPLSADQTATIRGVLTSGRAADVIVGPAGTGKSHTMGVLAVEWSAVTSGRVHGVASAQIAAHNLAGIGLDARTIHQFLRRFSPTPDTGLTRDRLGQEDLIVVDEAGMTPTTDLVAIANLAGAAGAKVVYVGDHHQLQPVGAGGMFAHLAAQPEALELGTVHRFAETWEADASLLLRAGDPAAAVEYADRGRLVCGTMDEITAMAVRGHVADMLDGKTALLIVSSNELAADLSRAVRRELVVRGRVSAEPLMRLPDSTTIGIGDLIQARLNDGRLYVAAGPDGSAMPVTNKAVYSVIGRHEDGTLLARDERGAVAHLPEEYVRRHVTLAYAVTGHAAQGVTVDVGRGILALDTTREQAYVPASRGRERNLLYLQTEHHPDPHDPQRVEETPVQRLTDILSRTGVDEAALTALEVARADETSMATLGALFAGVSELYAHNDNAQILSEVLDSELAETARHDPALGALLGAVYAAEIDGHDPRELLTEAVRMSNFDGARSIAQVLHWRVGVRIDHRQPEGNTTSSDAEPRSWTAFVHGLPEDHPVRGYLIELGQLIEQRQADLGARAAADPPPWAQQRLPDVPDPADVEARAEWERRAGAAAAYREYRGIPEAQLSFGEPPPPAQQLARAMWLAVVEQLDEDPVVGRWSRASDAELLQARETWHDALRDADENGPRSVSDEMSTLHRLAAEIRDDAVLTRADADRVPATERQHDELVERAARYRELAERYRGEAKALEQQHAARQQWWDQVAPLREASDAAEAEILRRQSPSAGSRRTADDGMGSTPAADQSAQRSGVVEGDIPGHDDGPELRDQAVDSVRADEEAAGVAPTAAAASRRGGDAADLDPVHEARDGIRPQGDARHEPRTDRGPRDRDRAVHPRTGSDGPAARAEADQRAIEAARRGQHADGPTPNNGVGVDPVGPKNGTYSDRDLGADSGYDWD